jgi:hypothetical protein
MLAERAGEVSPDGMQRLLRLTSVLMTMADFV